MLTSTGRAIDFALERHKGQIYAGLPYMYHLSRVATVAGDFGFIDYVHQAASWLHDTVEDTPTTLDDIESLFGVMVARHVWACTGVGPNRKARNAEIYRRLAEFPEGCIVKTADRIANIEASIIDPGTLKPNHGMAAMYFREREDFLRAVVLHIPLKMKERLNKGYGALEDILTNKEPERA